MLKQDKTTVLKAGVKHQPQWSLSVYRVRLRRLSFSTSTWTLYFCESGLEVFRSKGDLLVSEVVEFWWKWKKIIISSKTKTNTEKPKHCFAKHSELVSGVRKIWAFQSKLEIRNLGSIQTKDKKKEHKNFFLKETSLLPDKDGVYHC